VGLGALIGWLMSDPVGGFRVGVFIGLFVWFFVSFASRCNRATRCKYRSIVVDQKA
jgi:hypothetical protein